MSDEGQKVPSSRQPLRESIPLLLARMTQKPPPPPAPKVVPPVGSRSTFAAAAKKPLGAIGMLAAALLALVAVFADVLASDLPLACSLHGKVYLFPNVTRPLDLEAMGGDAVATESTWAVRAVVKHGPGLSRRPQQRLLDAPSKSHPLGTDRLGRDVFARVVHGARSYLVFALLAVAASLALGAIFGGMAGLFGGVFDAFTSRAIETVGAFPPLVLVLGIQAAVPRATLSTLFLAIALTRWPEVARLVRGQVMLATTRDYVMAARALGASPLRVLRRHIAPNVRAPLIVAAAIGVATVVLTEASLDFLHVGPAVGASSWGETMSEFRDATHAWWLLLFPGLFMVVTVVGHNLAGEALRDALDPRSR